MTNDGSGQQHGQQSHGTHLLSYSTVLPPPVWSRAGRLSIQGRGKSHKCQDSEGQWDLRSGRWAATPLTSSRTASSSAFSSGVLRSMPKSTACLLKWTSFQTQKKCTLTQKTPIGKLTLNAIGLHEVGAVHENLLWNVFYLLSLQHKKNQMVLFGYWWSLGHSQHLRDTGLQQAGALRIGYRTLKDEVNLPCPHRMLPKLREGTNRENYTLHLLRTILQILTAVMAQELLSLFFSGKHVEKCAHLASRSLPAWGPYNRPLKDTPWNSGSQTSHRPSSPSQNQGEFLW